MLVPSLKYYRQNSKEKKRAKMKYGVPPVLVSDSSIHGRDVKIHMRPTNTKASICTCTVSSEHLLVTNIII